MRARGGPGLSPNTDTQHAHLHYITHATRQYSNSPSTTFQNATRNIQLPQTRTIATADPRFGITKLGISPSENLELTHATRPKSAVVDNENQSKALKLIQPCTFVVSACALLDFSMPPALVKKVRAGLRLTSGHCDMKCCAKNATNSIK